MAFTLHRATLALATPLGTPLTGDTLFGQLCWALREAQGETELTRRLDGYTHGQPWLVVSDGFPAGYLPKPTLPQHFEPARQPEERKAAKKKRWVPVDLAARPLAELLASDRVADDAKAYGQAPQRTVQAHNTIDRHTGTTGTGEFAPYSLSQTFHAASQKIDLYCVLDDNRVTPDEVRQLITAIGHTGFGRDASTGLGKFEVLDLQTAVPPAPTFAKAYWTLAPCAPQGQGFDGEKSYWRVLTRFGRHGNAHALAANPFKNPLLLAATGAVFVPTADFTSRPFVGQGLGGKSADGQGRLSKTEPATVHQGYAPVLPLQMESIAS
jgi:CRISPR-associated protein Csm4